MTISAANQRGRSHTSLHHAKLVRTAEDNHDWVARANHHQQISRSRRLIFGLIAGTRNPHLPHVRAVGLAEMIAPQRPERKSRFWKATRPQGCSFFWSVFDISPGPRVPARGDDHLAWQVA